MRQKFYVSLELVILLTYLISLSIGKFISFGKIIKVVYCKPYIIFKDWKFYVTLDSMISLLNQNGLVRVKKYLKQTA